MAFPQQSPKVLKPEVTFERRNLILRFVLRINDSSASLQVIGTPGRLQYTGKEITKFITCVSGKSVWPVKDTACSHQLLHDRQRELTAHHRPHRDRNARTGKPLKSPTHTEFENRGIVYCPSILARRIEYPNGMCGGNGRPYHHCSPALHLRSNLHEQLIEFRERRDVTAS